MAVDAEARNEAWRWVRERTKRIGAGGGGRRTGGWGGKMDVRGIAYGERGWTGLID